MNAATQVALECRSVSKHFGALKAVENVSFSVNEGEILGIGGPNGAGKTTLFEVASGFLPATSGEVLVFGQSIGLAHPQAVLRRGVARIFQANTAFDSLTVFENVLVGSLFGRGQALPLRATEEHRELVVEALTFVGLMQQQNTLAGDLSVLDRKRLMLASALATKPRILMMDEPVGGLTAAEIDEIAELTERLRDIGMTVVLIEHVMRFMARLASRVMILHHGEKIFEGAPEALGDDKTVRRVYLGETADRLADSSCQTKRRSA